MKSKEKVDELKKALKVKKKLLLKRVMNSKLLSFGLLRLAIK